DVMNAMAHLRVRIGNVLRMQTLVDRLPTLAAIIGAERARRRDRDEDSLRIFWIEQNRVQTHSARAWLPLRSGAVPAQSRELFPILPAIFRFEQRCIFHARVNVIRIGQRWLEMPDPFEFPRMLGAVVPHM